nr:PREDICTED: odorant receptor 46a, isoform A-like [Megachile rotundata]
MFQNTSPEKAITFTRFCLALSLFLPLSSRATKLQTICYKSLKFIVVLSSFFLFLPIINSLCMYQDPTNVSQSVCFLMGEFQLISNTIIGTVQYDRLQEVIEVMEACCKNATLHEKVVFQRYINTYSPFYGSSAIWFYVTGMILILGTLVSSEPFPTNAEYPFPVDYQPLETIVFLHQSLVLIQCCAHACINMFCAFLLLFAAARFEILKMELREVMNIEQFVMCVEKYYTVKRYAKQVVSVVRLEVLCMLVLSAIAVVFCGIILIQPQPLATKGQYLPVVGTALLEVFVIAWPADHLLDMSENVMHEIYKSKWYDQDVRMQRDVRVMMLPQKAVAIKVPCLISTLSLNYFCSFISNVFSLFSVLRIAILKDG